MYMWSKGNRWYMILSSSNSSLMRGIPDLLHNDPVQLSKGFLLHLAAQVICIVCFIWWQLSGFAEPVDTRQPYSHSFPALHALVLSVWLIGFWFEMGNFIRPPICATSFLSWTLLEHCCIIGGNFWRDQFLHSCLCTYSCQDEVVLRKFGIR